MSVLGGTFRPGQTSSMVLVIMFHTFFSTVDRLLSKCSLGFLEHLFNFLSVRVSGSLAQFFYGKNLVNQLNYVVTQFCSSTFNTTSVIAHVNCFYFLKEILCNCFLATTLQNVQGDKIFLWDFLV